MSSSGSPSEENEFCSIDAARTKFSQKQLGVLKRVVTNFLIYRFKSKMVTCFQKWQKKPKPPQVTTKRVGFKLEAQSPTKKSVKNVLLQKNKKMLVRVLTAWSQHAQQQRLKALKRQEKAILKQLKIKKPQISKRIQETAKLLKHQENLPPQK